MTNLLSFSFLITVMVFTVLGALLGLARGFKKSIVRIISVILSGILAYLLAAPIAKLFINENSIHSIVSALNFEETYNELVTASPALEELFAALPIAIVAPLVFLVLFFFLICEAKFHFLYVHFFLFFCEQKRKKCTQRKRKDAIVLIILTYVRLKFQLGFAQSFTLTIVATQHVRETKAERQAKRLARLRVRACPQQLFNQNARRA